MIQNDQLAGLGIHAGGHQLGCGGDNRETALRVDEVVQLRLARRIVAGDAHHIAGVLRRQVGVLIDQRLAHALGVVGVLAKDDGLGVTIDALEILGHLAGHQGGALLQHQGAVEIPLVVDTVLNQLAVIIPLARFGPPALKVPVQVDAHHLVGGQKTVIDAALEGVFIHRLAEIGDVGYLFGLLGGGGQADVGGVAEIVQDLPPGGIVGGAAPVAFVHHHQVEEIGGELTVDVALLLAAGHRLVEGEVDFIGLVDGAVGDFGHGRTERLEVVGPGLVHQNVAVGQKENAPLCPGLPQPPDDLESGVGLAGTSGHHQQNAVLPPGYGLDGAIDGVELVIAGTLAAGVHVVVLGDNLLGRVIQPLPGAVTLPKLIRRGEGVQGDFLLHQTSGSGSVMKQKGISVAAEDKGNLQGIGIAQGLLHAIADSMVVVLGLDDGDGDVGFVVEDVVRPLAFGCVPAGQLATHDDGSGGEGDLLTDLGLGPARTHHRRGDELGADVPFAQAFFIQTIQ